MVTGFAYHVTNEMNFEQDLFEIRFALDSILGCWAAAIRAATCTGLPRICQKRVKR